MLLLISGRSVDQRYSTFHLSSKYPVTDELCVSWTSFAITHLQDVVGELALLVNPVVSSAMTSRGCRIAGRQALPGAGSGTVAASC